MWWSAQKSPPRKGCSDGVGCGVGQRGGGRGLAEAITPQGLGGAAEEVGGGTDAVMDRPEQEDELRDYEQLCASGEALMYAAMIRLMTRRLARV